jgi:SAM-dependent methyltransferase
MAASSISLLVEGAARHNTTRDIANSSTGRLEMSTAQVPAIDMNKLNAFIGQFVTDLGAAVHAGMVVIGEKLGLYKALAGGPMSSAELASRTRTDERYLREWLSSQAAGGYITYDDKTGKFSLTEEQAFTLADEDSPAYLPGAFELALGSLAAVPRIADSFRTGAGMGWHEHADGVFHGCEKFFRPGYAANLVSSWIPALHEVGGKLESGARVADVGCGKGASTIVMAKAFPQSRFFGFDYHDKSIEAAREAAKRNGVADRVTFEVAKAKTFPGHDYDFVAVFDCLHDMGDPIGAAAHVRQSLAKDGTWMIVEPFANDQLKDNLNPVGRVYYSFSTLLCTPCSRSQEVGLCLGAQAGETRIREVVNSAGFNRFRRATETPFNIVYEARP